MSLSRFRHSLEHAAILALVLLMAFASMTLAAAGGNFILGLANNSGTAQTALIANTTFPLHGLVVQQGGSGNGGYFVSQSGSGMLGITKSGNKYAMSGTNDGAAGTGGAIIGAGKNNLGLVANSDADWGAHIYNSGGGGGEVFAGGVESCPFFCAATGLEAYGSGFGSGVYGEADLIGVQGAGIWGVYGADNSGDGSGLGVYSDGSAFIDGDLEVVGTCTGCTAALAATNGSGAPLAAGTPVTIVGMGTDANGNTVASVGPAAKGDAVVGVVSSALDLVSQELADGSTKHSYRAGGPTAAAGGMVRVVTSGIAQVASDASAIVAGDAVEAAGGGKATKSTGGPRIGWALGAPSGGKVTILVNTQ